MGNINSSINRINNNYNRDTLVYENIININNLSEKENHDKIYLVPIKKERIFIVYELRIKIYLNNIYLYSRNIINDKTNLIHVFNNTDPNIINYIQVSKDMKHISLVENNNLMILKLDKLVENNKLEYILTDKININDKITVRKTIIFENILIFIGNGYINIYNYKLDIRYRINISNDSIIKISDNGVYLCAYRDNNLFIYNLNSRNIKALNGEHELEINNLENINNININDKIIFYCKNKNYTICNIIKNKKYEFNTDIALEKLVFNIREINEYRKILKCDNIYLMTGVSDDDNIYYWILINDNSKVGNEFIATEKYVIKNIENNDYIYTNGIYMLSKNNNKIIINDLERVIPINILEIILNNILILNKNQNKNNKYVSLIGSDQSSCEYKIEALVLNFININNNEYIFEHNVNINIYDKIKSFEIFMKMITNIKHIDNILDNMFDISLQRGRHNIMETLLEHIFEYIKYFIDDDMNSLRYIYIVILILLIKYYNRYYLEVSNNNSINIFGNFSLFYKLIDITPPIFKEFIEDIIIKFK